MADGARARAALGADKGDDLPDRAGLRIGIDVGDAVDDLQHLDRRHDIFAHPPAQQLAVQQHVVDMADGHDLGARIADLGETVEIAEHLLAVEQRFDDDQIGRRGVAVEGDRRLHAAHLHRDMRLGEPPVLASPLDHRGGVLVFAKRLDVDARDRPRAGRLELRLLVPAQRRRRPRAWRGTKRRRRDHWPPPIGLTLLALACSAGPLAVQGGARRGGVVHARNDHSRPLHD